MVSAPPGYFHIVICQKMKYICTKFCENDQNSQSKIVENLQNAAFLFEQIRYLNHFHTVNFGSEMVLAKHVSGKNIFCSMNKEKIMEERIFEIVHCPFEGRAKLHHLCQLNGPVGLCQLGGNSKVQCAISKILFPLFLYKFIEQNMFFPETCFAYTILKPEFMV